MIDPKLIYALTRSMLEREGATLSPNDPMIYIYVRGQEGRYEIQRGNLYHRGDLLSDYFVKAKIIPRPETIKYVVIERHGTRETQAFKWSDFCKKIAYEN